MTLEQFSWHLGGTLCDTVYTAQYYHHPEAIYSQALRAYVLGYVKCVELVYNELARGNILDGEDVWLDHHGVSIGMGDTVEQIVMMLDEALAGEAGHAASVERTGIQQRLLQRRVNIPWPRVESRE
jgi:hypothetical protein